MHLNSFCLNCKLTKKRLFNCDVPSILSFSFLLCFVFFFVINIKNCHNHKTNAKIGHVLFSNLSVSIMAFLQILIVCILMPFQIHCQSNKFPIVSDHNLRVMVGLTVQTMDTLFVIIVIMLRQLILVLHFGHPIIHNWFYILNHHRF